MNKEIAQTLRQAADELDPPQPCPCCNSTIGRALEVTYHSRPTRDRNGDYWTGEMVACTLCHRTAQLMLQGRAVEALAA